jgi:hypothetical protein
VGKGSNSPKWISTLFREKNSLESLKLETKYGEIPTENELRDVFESLSSNTSMLHFDSYYFQTFDILEILYRNAMLKKIKPKNLMEVRIFNIKFIWK